MRAAAGAPPAPFALPTISSTASRLSAEMQIRTSLEVCASAILFGVNWRNLSWVSSMVWMVSENTMQDAVWSENCSFCVAPIA